MESNNKLKIKLFYLPGAWSAWWRGIYPFMMLPYGMGVITAALRQNGYYVEQDDFLAKAKSYKNNWKVEPTILTNKRYVERCLNRGILESKLNQLADEILKMTSYNGFDVIGFSILSYPQFLFALLLAEKIKQNTKSTIVFGGAFITLQGEMFFSKYSFIDFMIAGDGEVPFLKLLDLLQGRGRPEEIPGLLYRDNGMVKINPREFYNIEDMPIPDFDGLPLDLYRISGSRKTNGLILPYQISRGCPYRCSFCTQRAFHKVGIKSFDKIIRELREYSERYQSNYFWFCDWTINISYQHMDRLCDLLIENKLNLRWKAWARVDNLDKKLLEKMRKTGCVSLLFGIESGSDRILKLMRKDFNVEETSKALQYTHAVGIHTYIMLMVGFLYENRSDINRTIALLEKNVQYIDGIISVNTFLLEFNSPIYNNPEEFKIENLKPEYGGEHRNYFAFDEINGLRWKQKVKQQRKAYYQVLKAVYCNIFVKHRNRAPIPFWVWFRKRKYEVKNKAF